MTESLTRLAIEPPMHGADNPLALSLNENPFSPLPAVQAAIVAAVGTANRYPEFLPERLRGVIARHITTSRSSSARVLPGSLCRYCMR